MNTRLFFVLLISVTAIILIDAGCGPRSDISNAVFTDDVSCNAITITCKNGYWMHQLLSCVDNQWIYQEPNCAPECYKLTPNFGITVLLFGTYPDKDIEACKEKCDMDDEWNSFTMAVKQDGSEVCLIFPRAILGLIDNTNLTKCIGECNEEQDCRLISHSSQTDSCILINCTLINLPPEIYSVSEKEGDTIGEKLC